MEIKETGIFYAGASAAAAKPVEFPKELQRHLFARLEGRFLLFLVSTAVILISITLLLSLRDMPEEVTEEEILQIQERYARLVLDQPKPKLKEKEIQEQISEQEVAEPQEKKKEAIDREKETFVERQQRKEATREERKARREEVQQEIQSTGIFAAITSSGDENDAGSAAVSDLLGATSEGIGDLSDIDISKGTFATKKVDPAALASRKGERTSGVSIKKDAIGKTSGSQIASAGKVAMTSSPPEVKAESGATVTSKSCIQKIVNRESKRLKRVYENWLKRDPSLSGQLKVKFTILPSGGVTNVSVAKSSTNNTSFDQNIIRYVKRWSFSSCSVAEPIEVIYPFAFTGMS
ncbi:MAG: TonB family protein [Chitinivibrionales bacterium]|nr:TonB family protein [Chitinivibrionales bacterium]